MRRIETREQALSKNDLRLPIPHPFDFDWRFDEPTIKYLADFLLRVNTQDEPLLLLGAPSIFLEMARRSNGIQVILLDKNLSLNRSCFRDRLPDPLILIQHDLRMSTLRELDCSVGVALCDPPWYLEHYEAFLVQAAFSTKIGALTVVSLLPDNTRPSASEDRKKIITVAQEIGLVLEYLIPNSIQYQTPPFEANAFRAVGIEMGRNWRCADIAVFRKTANPRQEYIDKHINQQKAISNPVGWQEYLYNSHKVVLRGPFSDTEVEPALLSIENMDVLPTVSRRYSGRDQIDLWLWDNRVYAVRGKASFKLALDVMTNSMRFADVALSMESNVNSAIQQLELISVF